jgi:glutamate:GABA antiporter
MIVVKTQSLLAIASVAAIVRYIPAMNSATETRPALIKALGLWDVVAMNIVAVVGLRWIARSARLGAPSVTLWILACVTFFVPLAVTLAELSNRYPEQGGVYVWVRRAFGPVHGFICGWCLWVNNLFYFPSLLLFAAANALVIFGGAGGRLDESRVYSVTFVLVVLWALIGLNIVGLTQGKRLHNLGSHATWIPAALLIAFGAMAFAIFGSATSFVPSQLWPRDDVLSTIGLWSAMCFAFSGFEITSFIGQEIRDPERTIPRGILIAGFAVTLIYIAGSASVLVALPASALAERSGISDAVELVSQRLGLAGFGALTGALLAVGSVGGTSSWIAGAARVPFAAGVDHVLPRAFAKLHPMYRTPHVSLTVQGLAATSIFLSSVFLSVTGGRTSIQEAYDILVNLTILIYFVPYLYLFPALIRLRRNAPAVPHPLFTVPGGAVGVTLAAMLGFLATLISVALVFVPPSGGSSSLNYEVNLIGQAVIILAIGAMLFWRSRKESV